MGMETAEDTDSVVYPVSSACWLGRIKLEMARTASRLLGCPGARAWALGAGQQETRACACAVCVCVLVAVVSRGSDDGSRYQQISRAWQGQWRAKARARRNKRGCSG